MKQRLQAWGHSKVIEIACCLLFNPQGEILLLQRHPDNLGGKLWGMPGGRREPGEAIEQTALRELQEETGLELAHITLLGTHEANLPHGSLRMTSFTATIPADSAIVLAPDEHQAYAWFDPNTLTETENIIWAMPTILRDFGFIHLTISDPTLPDGTIVTLLHRAT
jgi:8-oxo-dGTP diphosphatase